MSKCGLRVLRSLQRNSRKFSTSTRSLDSKSTGDLSEEFTTPLTKALKNAPTPLYAPAGSETFQTSVTKLSDGLTVTSQPKFGTFCTVGILVDAGSRHEVSYPSGTSHFLERMGFSGSLLHKTRDDIMQVMERLGGICDCQSSRDTTIYAASIDRTKLEELMELLGDVVFQPSLQDSEFEFAQSTVQFELEMLNKKPDPEPMMTELIHEASFRGNTVGLPRYSMEDRVNDITKENLKKFLRSYYLPSRMVVAGVGVDHDELCMLSEKYISNFAKSPSWGLEGPIERDESVAQYTGGDVRVEKNFDLSLSVVPMPELAHVSIGMESVSFTHEDFVPYAVLNMLMGGGGSFSAGGPGKGMFSRLYLNVLNRHHWMYAATAYHHSYEDCGVFCIQGSSHPTQLRECVHVITQEFAKLVHGTNQIELERAKKQLQSMLMMNLEARPIIFEDVGRQILSTGKRKSPQELCELIDKVTNDDIVRVGQNLLSGNPAVAGLGNLKSLPGYDEVKAALRHPEGKLARKFRLFGN